MFQWIWGPIADLPPVHWLLNLGLWDSWAFAWIGSVVEFIGAQESLKWAMDRFAGLTITGAVVGLMFLHLVWYMWAWYRGAEIKYDPVKAVKWTSGPRKGKRKKHPVKLEIALTRRYAWPLLCLPLFLVGAGMYVWTFVLWPGKGSLMLMPIAWFVTTPLRRMWFIWVARKAYRANHGNKELTTSFMDDVVGYFTTGIAPSPKRRMTKAEKLANFEPSFEGGSWISRRLIWGERVLCTWQLWPIWRWLCFWRIFRFWGLLAQLALAFFWPIACAVAPFLYTKAAEDYQEWMNPWWRRYRDNEYSGGTIVTGEVVKKDDDRT